MVKQAVRFYYEPTLKKTGDFLLSPPILRQHLVTRAQPEKKQTKAVRVLVDTGGCESVLMRAR